MVPSTESSTVGDGCAPTRGGILMAVPSREGRRSGGAVPRRDAWWRPGAALGSASGPQPCGRRLPAPPRVRRSGVRGIRGDASKPSLSEEGSGREGVTLAAPPRSDAGGLEPPVTLGWQWGGGHRGPHFRAGATETGWGGGGGATGALPRVGLRRSLRVSVSPPRWGGLGLAGAMLAGPRWNELGRLNSPRKGPGGGETREAESRVRLFAAATPGSSGPLPALPFPPSGRRQRPSFPGSWPLCQPGQGEMGLHTHPQDSSRLHTHPSAPDSPVLSC